MRFTTFPCALSIAAFAVLLAAPCASPQNTVSGNREIGRKVEELLRQMTVEEKIGQLTQYTSNRPETLELVRQGKVGSLFNVTGAQEVNAAQRIAVEQTRLKIPLIIGYDVIHGYRTIFPIPLATASSFDPELIEQIERVAAEHRFGRP